MKNRANNCRITISFSRKNIDIYEYIIRQDNASKFICKIVRDKMDTKNESDDPLFKEKVINIIDDYLANKKITYTGESTVNNIPELDIEMTAAMDTFEF